LPRERLFFEDFMRARIIFAATCAAALLACAGCGKPPAADGAKPFQGLWNGIGADGKRTNQQANFDKDIFMLIETATSGLDAKISVPERSAFRVDSSQTPPHIDFVCLEGDNQSKTKFGIFALDGNKLKICFADFDDPRPTAFVAGEKTTLLIFERGE
jgi:uncharacterized protein (TIGR03067 family)